MPGDDVGKRERVDSLDIARGLGMILVIYGHVLQIFFHKRADGEFSQMAFAQWQAIYGFHMPLFFLISGALVDQFSGKSWRDAASRSAYLVILAYIVDAIGILFGLVVQGTSSDVAPSVEDYLIDHILLAENFSTITPWFLVAFAIVRFTAYAIVRFDGAARWFLVAVLTIVFAASYRWPQAFHIRAVLPGVAFFLLGRYLFEKRIDVDARIAAIALATALWLAHENGGCTFAWQDSCENAELPGHFAVLMIFGLVGSLPLFLVTAALGGVGVIGLSGAIARTRLSSPIRSIGRNSLDFLLINGFYLVFANPYLRDHVAIGDTLVFFVAVAILATLVHIVTFQLLNPLLSRIKACAQETARLSIDVICAALGRLSGAPRGAA